MGVMSFMASIALSSAAGFQLPDRHRLHCRDVVEELADRSFDLRDGERLAADTWLSGFASTRYWSRSTVLNWPVFISGTRILSKPLSSSPRFFGQRPDVADVDVADVEALRARAAHRLVDRAVGRTPADDGQLAAGLAQRDILRRECRWRRRRSWPCGRRSSPGGWRAHNRCCRCRRPSRCRRCGASGPGVPGLIQGARQLVVALVGQQPVAVSARASLRGT